MARVGIYAIVFIGYITGSQIDALARRQKEELMFKIGLLAATTFVMALVLVGTASASAQNFAANLLGSNLVPPVATDATGQAHFATNSDGTELSYSLSAANIDGVVAAHIHCAAAGVNGAVGVTLFSGGPVGSGLIAEGILTGPNAANGCGWTTMDIMMAAIESGDTYVNVHTTAHPAGEIRGQIDTLAQVGGVTSYLAGGSGTSIGTIAALAGAAVAAFALLATGTWYTRRRWPGSRS